MTGCLEKNDTMMLEDLYTPLEEAKIELQRRQEDHDLHRQVDEFLGGTSLGVGKEPRAFLCRTIQTPNREFFWFAKQAEAACLIPAAQEYLDDRFCSMNPDKLNIVRMTFYKGKNRHNEPIIRRITVRAGDKDGIPFSAIATPWGENLIAFHHKILRQFFPNIIPVNESAWYRANGGTPEKFYPAHFARFLCHGILFENYFATRHEAPFTRDVVLPAFESVCSRFGLKPLIVRLLPDELAGEPSWTWYDSEIENLVRQELSSVARLTRSPMPTSSHGSFIS